MQRKWVVIGSSNGSSNYGDEMMWENLVLTLRDLDPSCLIVTDAFPGWEPPFNDVKVLQFIHKGFNRYNMTPSRWRPANKVKAAYGLFVNRGALLRGYGRVAELRSGSPARGLEREWESALQESNGLIFSGAGGITDRFALHAIAGWGAIVALAQRNGVPVLFMGQGIGPIRDPKSRRVAADMLSGADHVGMRDTLSAGELEQMAPEAHGRADLDWAVVRPTPDHVSKSVDGFIAEKGLSSALAISIHDWTSASEVDRDNVRGIFREMGRVAAERGVRIVCVPNCVGTQRADDRSFMQAVIDGMEPELRRVYVQTPVSFDAYQTRHLLGRLSTVITSRYHPAVFALAEGTPVVGLAYDDYYVQKHEGALRWYDLERWVVDLRAPRPDRTWWHDTLDELRALDRGQLQDRTETLRAPAVQALRGWMDSVDHPGGRRAGPLV